MPVGLLGKKLGQTRVYDAVGNCIPVTVVLAGPNRVIQCKTMERDGYRAVQLGLMDQKEQRVPKPLLGHFKKHNALPVRRVTEFRNFSKDVKPGDVVGPDLFAAGDFVDAIGVTKGHGFEGVVRRHRFGGGDLTHGAKGWHRRSGAIGCRLFPGTVQRGMKMPGHLGQVRRTVQNLEVIQVRSGDNVLLIKGAIPGAKGDFVVLRESKKMPKGTVKRVAKQPEKGKGAKKAGAPAK
ncbi:MAG: 50S ribosomal protein L3 [Verrucomicrobia bacterium]|nr:50S ribosomal protein L3 [Verrucomicrobiota bacterium]